MEICRCVCRYVYNIYIYMCVCLTVKVYVSLAKATTCSAEKEPVACSEPPLNPPRLPACPLIGQRRTARSAISGCLKDAFLKVQSEQKPQTVHGNPTGHA